MMRKSTLLWLSLAAFCSTALFHTSQKVHDGREKIAALTVSITKEEESLRVLTAEWGYLNQPARLEKLAKTYLKLAPLKGSQLIKAEDIPLRPAATAPVAEVINEAPPQVIAEKSIEKPVEKTAEKAAEKNPAIPAARPAAAVTATPVKIIKPVTVAAPRKPLAAPAANASAGNNRNFSDLMKSLNP